MLKNLFILLFFTLFIMSCKKEEPLQVTYETIGGTWYLVSNICDSKQYFNTYYPKEDGPSIMETSCSTTITYDIFVREIERKFIIDHNQCWMQYTRLYQHPDYDATYSSCELQCCLVDTGVVDYLSPIPFAISLDKKSFVLSYEWGNVSGTTQFHMLQEFTILKLTEDTLIFAGGGGPDITSIYDSHSSYYTFVR